ncbi:Dihydrolipoyllysine-residue succinyltransferase component of 2-oxoglutarate dehydrogenase complex [Rickettsiales bacterium Ac37b]|nr:Dihydrolipoyllysine-residue succinyltransferase component of 2-oxoglutarate dehydrogenase complex [Rickettsiales bacterium Ac37b]
MAIDIKVPQLGESVTSATIAKWHKNPGDAVKADELLVELETDKITMEVNAPVSGVLEALKVQEGDTVEVGQVIGEIAEGKVSEQKADSKGSEKKVETKANERKPEKQHESEVLAPSVRKLVTENNLSPNNIPGTGKDNRIIKGDVLQVLNSKDNSSGISNDRQVERVKMTRLRKRIAERLKESQNTAAILTTFNEVDMSNVMALRSKHKDIFEKKHGVKLGFMSFFIKAAIVALQEIPAVNAEIAGEEIIYKNFYDMGVAVGTEQGLVVPVIRNAHKLSFAETEKTMVLLGKKAREGKLTLDDLSGGTFTISNGGVYGSLLSTPIINPPQSAILGMHNIQERPVAIAGKVEIRPMMYLALSYDHRIIDGKEAVTFLVRIKENIESPDRLLLGL